MAAVRSTFRRRDTDNFGEDTLSHTTKGQEDDPDIGSSSHHVEHVIESDALTGDDDESYTFDKLMALFSLTLAYMADSWVAPAIGALLTVLNEKLGPSKAYIWMSTAYILPQAVVAITSGRVSDIFGRRDMMIVANVICVVGCIVWATAKSVNVFIIGSAINGTGCGIHQISYASISELVPRKRRPLALGIYQTFLACIAAISPPAGKWLEWCLVTFTDHFAALLLESNRSWHDVFWIAIAFYVLSFILLFYYYRPVQGLIKTDGIPLWDHLRSLDYPGILLFATGMCLFLVGLSFGGGVFPWKSAGTLVPLLLGLIILVLFGVWEANCTSPFPLLPGAIMREVRFFLIPCAGAFLFGIVYYSTAVLWPTQIQALYETNAAKVGGMTAIPSATSSVGGLLAGYLFSRFGHGRELFIGVTVILTAVAGAQAAVAPGSKVASSIIVGLMGPSFAACAILVTAMVHLGVPHEYIGAASSIAFTCRTIGGSISTVVYLTILTNGLTKNLFPTVAKALAEAGVAETEIIPVATALIEAEATSPALAAVSPTALEAGVYAIKTAYAESFRTVYLVSIAFGALTIIAACFCGNFGKLMTNRIDVRLEKPSVHVAGSEGLGSADVGIEERPIEIELEHRGKSHD